MLKIIRCRDPFFAVKKRADRFERVGNREKTVEALLSSVKNSKSISLAFAEILFYDEESSVRLIEALEKSSCELLFFSKNGEFPSIIVQNAIFEEDLSSDGYFFDIIDKFTFSEEAKDLVKEQITGFSMSVCENILDKIGKMDEESALKYLISEKQRALSGNNLLESIPVDGKLSDIGGLSDLKHWISTRRSNFSEKAREFGIPMPKGVLLLGVQGCGKSLSAKTIASIWNFPLIRLDFINLFKKGHSAEELLKEAVLQAESFAPAILWIDEIEKALTQESSSPEIRRIIGWLVTWMQEKKSSVFLAATANRVSLLPPELLRKGRFDEIFFVDLPSAEEREEIFRIHLEKRGRKPADYDTKTLAKTTENWSGAEIEQVIVDALINDFGKNRELQQITLEEAARRTVPLAVTYEENIKELRLWCRNRARNASGMKKIESFFK